MLKTAVKNRQGLTLRMNTRTFNLIWVGFLGACFGLGGLPAPPV